MDIDGWHRAKFKCDKCSGNCIIKLDLEYMGEMNEEFPCLLTSSYKPEWKLQWRHQLKEVI
jgi:hypothetical protein